MNVAPGCWCIGQHWLFIHISWHVWDQSRSRILDSDITISLMSGISQALWVDKMCAKQIRASFNDMNRKFHISRDNAVITVLTVLYLAVTAATVCNSCERCCCCGWLTATDRVYETNIAASSSNNCRDVSKLCPIWLRHVDTSLSPLDPLSYTHTHTYIGLHIILFISWALQR